MADGLFGGAAFGVYPQMQPRRRLQDVQGAANLPVDVLRGRIAGLFGLVPDVLNFMGRSPMPTETFGETQYDPRPQLPYDTDFYLKNLPLAPTSRAGQVASQVGSLVPLNPAPLVRAGVAGAKALAPTAARMTEGFMQRQGFMPSVVPAQPSGLLTPEIPAPKPQAPVSDLGFYSAAEQAAMNLQRGKGAGQSFLNDLMKASDVKKDELQYTGLDEFLRGKPNVTRQEVQDFIAGNRVDVKEVSYGNIDFTKLPDQQLQKEYVRVRGYQPIDSDGSLMSREEIIYELSGAPTTDLTRYGKYQLPGGENYREILLKLPQQWDKPRAAQIANEERIKALRQEMYGTSGTNEIRSEISRLHNENTALQKQISEAPIYKSSHFDEPNILAHMRVNDRIDADGKKMLLIEEVQSDWHQAGREKGYQGKGTLKELPDNYFVQEIKTIDGDTMYVVRDNNNPGVVLNKDYNKQSAINGVINELNATSAGGVPDAPFKDTWHQLALKRALKEAVDKGYDRIGLTTGAQQAERYDLSKQINLIDYRRSSNNTFELGVVGKNGETVDLPKRFYTAEELPSVLGKEVADKIVKGEGEKGGGRMTLRGLDLQVGGEGMKKYYDEIYPAFLNKQGKKYGAQVGETQVPTDRSTIDGMPSMYQNKETVRYLDITPEMRKAVQKGQPLFAAAPVGVLTASEFDYTDPFGNTIADTTR